MSKLVALIKDSHVFSITSAPEDPKWVSSISQEYTILDISNRDPKPQMWWRYSQDGSFIECIAPDNPNDTPLTKSEHEAKIAQLASMPPLPKPIKITKLQAMKRFTNQELAAIYTAAKTDVMVEIWLEKFKAATEIDLTDEDFIDGVNSLETATLIAVGRAVVILTP